MLRDSLPRPARVLEIASGTGEHARFFKALGEASDYLQFAVKLALATGMRRQEILSLSDDGVNWRDRAILLQALDTKTATARVVHLNAHALAALKSWKLRGTNGEFFPGERECWEDRLTKREWKRLCKDAEVTDLHFHDCRHHFAVMLRKTGAPLEVVREALGHASITQTEKYAHVGPSEVKAAVERTSG